MQQPSLVTVDKPSDRQASQNCGDLEEGRLLFFPSAPFQLPEEQRQFLVQLRSSKAHFHKNIAYRPLQDRVTGAGNLAAGERNRLHQILRGYSQQAVGFLSEFLEPYAASWRLDYASFRPFQEEGRELSTRKRNDLLHLDNFPTRPTNGDMILRFFTNINPTQPRRWIATGPFEAVVQHFTGKGGMRWPRVLSGWGSLKYSALQTGRRFGLPLVARPPYDAFMLRLHHRMKEDDQFQKDCPKLHLEFPPGSSWMVFTDRVAHAALSGQYALEQTLLISRNSLLSPQKAPLRILERLSGTSPLNDLFWR